MKFTAPEVLRKIAVAGPGKVRPLPQLTDREAWLLDQFLEAVHDALWEHYAETILDYEDRLASLDRQPSEHALSKPPPHPDQPDIPF